MSIFLVPPSKNSIYERLKSRATQSGDDEKAINNRMKQYETEMSHRDQYNHIVINDNFENCISEIESIINHHREKIK